MKIIIFFNTTSPNWFLCWFHDTCSNSNKNYYFQVVPYDDPDRIPSPSPEPSPLRQRVKHARPFTRRIYPRVPSEISLSTITEESQSCHSHEIVVQPEVTVETTTVTNTTNGVTTVNTSTSSPEVSFDFVCVIMLWL